MYIPLCVYRHRGGVVGENSLEIGDIGRYEKEEVSNTVSFLSIPSPNLLSEPPFVETNYSIMVRVNLGEESVKLSAWDNKTSS